MWRVPPYLGCTDGFQDIRSFELEKGRYFSPIEANAGRNVVVIGQKDCTGLLRGSQIQWVKVLR